MNYYDDENRIIKDFQLHFEDWMSFPNLPEPGDIIIESIADVGQWKDWINSSGKDAPPPDFYNDKLQLMMDVMRVDDHTFIGKKGKPVNLTNARESQIQKKLHELGFFQIFPNAKAIQVNAITDLPTYEDHNYKFYLSNFKLFASKGVLFASKGVQLSCPPPSPKPATNGRSSKIPRNCQM